ncbi:hypothetical protein BFP70_07735 [Thioclava sp. SK-1]|uniref:TfoX/Sxy family protein n=1 Tax=Thioclava sp. SK-1 TaxID=1889770 RepID=UPI000825071A|nr:TfoX/Sxy family protein [Thioclava sp. SK-1]OCX66005.1 hypothetical protein BFP70_07735 [Thioclava sp. SK-1]
MPVSPDVELFLREQLLGRVRTRRMFGGYGVYADDKCVAFLLNDALYLRPIAPAQDYLIRTDHEIVTDSPVKGAQPYLRIDPDLWEDSDWLMGLINVMHAALPPPKPKPAKPDAARTPKQ